MSVEIKAKINIKVNGVHVVRVKRGLSALIARCLLSVFNRAFAVFRLSLHLNHLIA